MDNSGALVSFCKDNTYTGTIPGLPTDAQIHPMIYKSSRALIEANNGHLDYT